MSAVGQDPVPRAARRTRGTTGHRDTHDRRRLATHDAPHADRAASSSFARWSPAKMPPPPMLELLDIRLAEVEEGRVVFAAVAEERFYNGTGVAHGGFAATLLDSALGCAINSTMPAGKRFTTLELKINSRGRSRARSVRCAARRTSSTSAAAPPRRKAASSIATANSTPTARRRASSSNRRAEPWNPDELQQFRTSEFRLTS